ncbi:hypothetical protein [Legionella pneumophila]|uniref:FBOX-containing protein n=1 Tax=Legionella pneumophila subsp. pascullei TaxID=91890 RepID=A0AAX2ISZ5_LEGPN|nr:hypothetical protein [Legionella pneumophila]AMP88346.1 hypothetical protein AXF35_00945 [Legionella pneumophila subsp. pascullei]AMP91255.1 hypothetical protein AXF36_00945 [Legionella pneumophila subsp. pascullei]AMP94242.1 hypothetical protein AXF37_00945 [Legionella pneumophila subsp. pascullei]SQG89023.1 FBOX-containing protein [Legionella pneumophila subsp. pascullei]VEH04073.1 FBOX-containing protein [Legionella pneumophila subsp. pascullei]
MSSDSRDDGGKKYSKRHRVLIKIFSVILLFAALTSLADYLVDYFIESDTKVENSMHIAALFNFSILID